MNLLPAWMLLVLLQAPRLKSFTWQKLLLLRTLEIRSRPTPFRLAGKWSQLYTQSVLIDGVSLSPQAGVQWCDLSSLQLPPSDSSDSSASASRVTGTTGARHHSQLIFVFLVETGFHHIGQDGLDLLTS
uniref:Secreted protein n=1 Tax=Macaca fascicularis TaxID=9541 RepID=A0A7N9CA33_MACFA